MAKIEDALDLVFKLEFSSPKDALEVNATENGFTFMGVYQAANPNWPGWPIVQEAVDRLKDRKQASIELYSNKTLKSLVVQLYKENYWDVARLDEIDSQHTATEIFVFGVNAGMKKAVKLAQRVVGCLQDGQVGPQTLRAINSFNDAVFDSVFDMYEKEYYQAIVDKNPTKKIFLNGWRNRADAV